MEGPTGGSQRQVCWWLWLDAASCKWRRNALKASWRCVFFWGLGLIRGNFRIQQMEVRKGTIFLAYMNCGDIPWNLGLIYIWNRYLQFSSWTGHWFNGRQRSWGGSWLLKALITHWWLSLNYLFVNLCAKLMMIQPFQLEKLLAIVWIEMHFWKATLDWLMVWNIFYFP